MISVRDLAETKVTKVLIFENFNSPAINCQNLSSTILGSQNFSYLNFYYLNFYSPSFNGTAHIYIKQIELIEGSPEEVNRTLKSNVIL
jgi:hypothetical protein